MANFIDRITSPEDKALTDLAFHTAAKEGETRTQNELITYFRDVLRKGKIIEMKSVDRKPVDHTIVGAEKMDA